MSRILLEEDDSAPDALMYFKHEFNEITGMPMEEFMDSAQDLSTYYEHKWVIDNLELSYAADHPFYILKDLTHE